MGAAQLMTLASSLVPKNTNEPIPRGPVVDGSRRWTEPLRGWFEGKGRQIGEVISGINRNAENIVQLETDYTAADGAVSSAYISADAVVAADALGARAALYTTISSEWAAGDSAIQSDLDIAEASIVTLQSTSASQGSAISTLQTDLSSEVTNRTNADTALQSDIDTRATVTQLSSTESTLNGSIAAVQTNLTSETASRISGDTAAETAANTYTDAEVAIEASARTTAITAEAAARETVRASLRGLGSGIPDPDYQDSDFWNLASGSGGTSIAPYFYDSSALFGKTSEYRSLYLSEGTHDFLTDYFPVTPGATYEITTFIWSGFAGFTGWVRPMIHVPGVQWQNAWSLGPASTPSDSSATAVSGDMTLAAFSGSETYRWTAPAGTSQIQIRTKADITAGTAVIIRYEMIKLSQYAETKVLQDAFVDSNGNAIARLEAIADAGGGNPARVGLLDSAGGSSASLDADRIFFGADTVFEDTHDTFYTEASSYRYRDRGPFGSSGDLLQWYGPTSVALNSETKTNGVWSMATDGKVRQGSNSLTSLSASPSVDQASYVGSASPQTTGSVTVTASGGVSPYTYAWSKVTGATFTVNSASSASTTFSTSANNVNGEEAVYRCTVTDGTGDKVRIDVGVLAIYIAPP